MSAPSGLGSLEQRIGYRFSDRALLTEAVTHGSVSTGGRASNQRLEFLGDRVLALCMASELMDRFGKDAVGDLAKRLNHLVSRQTCAEVARELDLGSVMRMSADSRATGGRRQTGILADATEALIAAIYRDGGWETARECVLRLWGGRIDIDLADIEDTKSRLQEFLLGRGDSLPVYRIVDRVGPAHGPLFTVSVSTGDGRTAVATASTKQEAEKKAAAKMLKVLDE